ncbi:MAG TPA: DUF3592 domain-containing protein [Candidatus Dormibacteraeota bacterium]|nr:DUF3592 domain-containing protein [Candidatus Dormibacteraeota bacterium]
MSFPIPNTVFGPVCLFLGGLAIVWTVLAYRSQRRFLARASQATATVQSLKAERLQRTTMYFPIVQFTTPAGVPITAESKTSGSFQIGQRISVLYDPKDPNNVEINGFWSRWVVVTVAACFAVILLIMGAAAMVAPHASSGGNLHG